MLLKVQLMQVLRVLIPKEMVVVPQLLFWL